MRVLIIGLGSIAKKHMEVIVNLVPNTEFIALRSSKHSITEKNIINISSISEVTKPIDFCIISNPTHLHYDAIKKAIKLNAPLFIEKPSLMNLEKSDELINLINKSTLPTYVAFNLRFLPVIEFLKEYVNKLNILEVNIYAGSYLPDWRPKVDYRIVYSASEEMGGGVHLDLIHEIDYATWLFGFPSESTSLTRKVSQLEIDSIDFASYHLLYTTKTVNITLNYYRKTPKRSIEILTDEGVIYADLLNQKITKDNGEILFSSDYSVLETYHKQMQYFLSFINFLVNLLCTYSL